VNREQRQAFVNIVMNLWVHKNVGNFLSSRMIIRSLRSLLQGVSNSDLRLFCLESDLHLTSTLDLLDAFNSTYDVKLEVKNKGLLSNINILPHMKSKFV
jgi:hypothetical protein